MDSLTENLDEFVENTSDKQIADLLDRLRKQALKNMLSDTSTRGGPTKEDVEILITTQTYKTQEKLNFLTKILLLCTVILAVLTVVLIYLTFKLV